MKFQVLNVSEENYSLEAFQASSFIYFGILVLSPQIFKTFGIKIDKLEDSESSFSVNLIFGQNMDIVKKSKIANRFVNELISKTKNNK